MEAPLHRKYAPILHVARDERFLPMAADRFLFYAALRAKGEDEPLIARGRVRPEDLLRAPPGETFLRSVERGPLAGMEVAQRWSRDTLMLIYSWAQRPYYIWSAEVAGRLYEWFSGKTAEATRRFWWNPLLWGARQLGITGGPGDRPQLGLPSLVRDQALESYSSAVGDNPRPVYHYRLVRDGAYLVLQYWFFYAYNDWAHSFDGFNDHEGDWEGVQLFFALEGGRAVEPPAFVSYQGHHSRLAKSWDHPDVHREGDHVHVYVAGGSHASYPEPKRYPVMSWLALVDDAAGDGRIVGPSSASDADWGPAVALDEAPWLTQYRGSWGTRYWLSLHLLMRMTAAGGVALPGDTQLPGVSAPRGPQYDDVGAVREAWGHPTVFAGVAEADRGSHHAQD